MPHLYEQPATPVSSALPQSWTVGEALEFVRERYDAAEPGSVEAQMIENALQSACVLARMPSGELPYDPLDGALRSDLRAFENEGLTSGAARY